jgi:hypothetical protein
VGAAFTATVTTAAWHDKPSYGIVPTADGIPNPDLERSLYKRARAKVTEVKGSSHAVFLSHPLGGGGCDLLARPTNPTRRRTVATSPSVPAPLLRGGGSKLRVWLP